MTQFGQLTAEHRRQLLRAATKFPFWRIEFSTDPECPDYAGVYPKRAPEDEARDPWWTVGKAGGRWIAIRRGRTVLTAESAEALLGDLGRPAKGPGKAAA